MNNNEIIKNNQVAISGKISSEFIFSHELYGEKFYIADLMVRRLSDNCDIIPIMVSDHLFDIKKDYCGYYVRVTGQFRSYNLHEERKNRLLLSVFAREIEFLDGPEGSCDINQIYLDGYICKEPVYRKTPLGREIADILLAVNRPYGKSDYIPCIIWGRNARYVSNFGVGERCAVWGRIQSRDFVKTLSDGSTEKRTAYEMSVSKVEILDKENNLQED